MIDLSGYVFEYLTVVSRAPNDKHGDSMYNCICSCGNKVVVRGSHLKSGNTKSCGCRRKEINVSRKDMYGQHIKGWYVLGLDNEMSNRRQAHWVCLCTACFDTKRTIAGQTLREGYVSHCRCMDNLEFPSSEWEILREYGSVSIAKCKRCGQEGRVSKWRIDNDYPTPCFECNTLDRRLLYNKEMMLGQQYRGFLIEEYSQTIDNIFYWRCKCLTCGIIEERSSTNLKARAKGAGCRSCAMKKSREGKVGEKAGKLTILEVLFKDGRTRYRCSCECGNEVLTYVGNFGKRFSCGCAIRTLNPQILEIDTDGADCLYILNAEDTYLKVGITRDINKRLAHIQSACPLVLRVLLLVEADRDKETEIKRALRNQHKHGEWYKYSQENIAMIEQLIKDRIVLYRD